MKIPEIDIEAVLKSIDGRPAEEALPANLKDATLHQVARDLRLIELSCTVDGGLWRRLTALRTP